MKLLKKYNLVTPGTLLLLVILFRVSSVNAQSSQTDEGLNSPYNLIGFVQQQYVDDRTPNTPAGFSIYRARVGLTGSITDNLRVRVLGGFVEPPQNNPQLLHAHMDYRINPLLTIRAGQFLLPFGIEGYEGIPLNPAIERSTAVRRLNTFRMFSDIGVQASGNLSRINYAVALVNGTGANQAEQINLKDVIGRIGIELADVLEIGLSGHAGNYQPAQVPDNDQARYRAGIDIEYSGDPVFFRGEFITRNDHQPDSETITMNGGYILGGLAITDRLEGITRFEYFTPNTEANDNRYVGYTVGANYYFAGRTRLSVNYEFRDDEMNPNLGNMLTMQMQIVL